MNKKDYGLLLKNLQENGMAGAGSMGPARSMMAKKGTKIKKEKKRPMGTYGTSYKVGTSYAASPKGESMEESNDIFEAIRSKHPDLKRISAKKKADKAKAEKAKATDKEKAEKAKAADKAKAEKAKAADKAKAEKAKKIAADKKKG